MTTVQYAPTIGMTADAQGYLGTVTSAFVEDCYATNPYSFLSWSGRHGLCNVKNVVGTFLLSGFIIDQSYDIDRLLDIHFNPNAAYVAEWAANGVRTAQFANNAVFMELAKADQAYLDRVFCYGGKTGLLLSNRGNAAASGASFGMCGFEGCDLPLSVTGAPQEIDFGFTQFGTSTDVSSGNHAILIAPAAGNLKNLNFSRCRSFRSVGSAIQAANVNGLNLNGFRAGNAIDKGDFARGVVSLSSCTEVQASGMNLDITTSGLIVPIIMNNCSNFTVNDNFFGGPPPHGGRSPAPRMVKPGTTGRRQGHPSRPRHSSAAHHQISSSTRWPRPRMGIATSLLRRIGLGLMCPPSKPCSEQAPMSSPSTVRRLTTLRPSTSFPARPERLRIPSRRSLVAPPRSRRLTTSPRS
ncbi:MULTISPECIES: hypothetical protein [unclassified Mesorhizobium]|uniref:hypothetical protein n=1 Tax=unclassified Mesorhizobium TaxID=325217 RepID=UPI0011282607|nr:MULTISPECIES: hypothetical protein [unclassified Mesorhizobium]MBZ9693567.1 hypothetical protein [Mesorhizobium sp. CO1-1-9]TPK17410.1 hypothetical protein FJ543_02550 [Mesorhizobium sp. B2-5-7]